jgi:two-component sensor histidine kinase
VVGIGGVGTDITERKRSEEHQRTLLAELQHRVRNILALLRSLIGRTSRSKDDLSDFVDHLQARIDAMARTQAILTRSAGAAVNLEDIVRDELLAVAAPDSKYRVRGPEVELASKAAELLTLAIHELATNSVKYGALGDTPGSLDVTWTCNQRDGKKFVELEWSERGLTLHRIPERRGFGSELITERVPYELQGRGEMAFSSNGLTATIAFPLVAKTSVLLTDRPRIAKVLV